MRPALVFFTIALSSCRPEAASQPPAPAKNQAEPRGTAMPDSLRCTKAADCAPEATCYWGEPSCVAIASAADPVVCGDDADPPRPEIDCTCNEGQCTAVLR